MRQSVSICVCVCLYVCVSVEGEKKTKRKQMVKQMGYNGNSRWIWVKGAQVFFVLIPV